MDVRAPLEYVYDWCTDYRTDDARREGARFVRRIRERTARRVVFEALADDAAGGNWSRVVVDRAPPDAWHAERRGNRREVSVDYRLARRGPGSTRLTIRLRRRSLVPERPRPSVAERRSAFRELWARLRRSLEADYRRSRTGRPRSRAHRRRAGGSSRGGPS